MNPAQTAPKPRALMLARRAAFPVHHDDEVLTFKEWCELNGFSARTGRRILDGPKSQRPVITWLSARRMGITRGNNRRWQEGRYR